MMKCKKCGKTLMQLMCFALMSDLGAELSWNPLECREGGEHDLVEIEKVPQQPEADEEAA